MKDWKYFWHVSTIFCAMWVNSIISFLWLTTESIEFIVTLNQLKCHLSQLNVLTWWRVWITQVKTTDYIDGTKTTQINVAILAAPPPAFCVIFSLTRLTRIIFLFKRDEIFSLQFNATYHWIQVNIFIIVNKYLIESIESFFSVYWQQKWTQTEL